MNEKEKTFRARIAPALRDLARLCRLNGNAFATIVEIEPGRMIQISYVPEKSALKQSRLRRLDPMNNKEHSNAGPMNEENVNIAKGIRAERG